MAILSFGMNINYTQLFEFILIWIIKITTITLFFQNNSISLSLRKTNQLQILRWKKSHNLRTNKTYWQSIFTNHSPTTNISTYKLPLIRNVIQAEIDKVNLVQDRSFYAIEIVQRSDALFGSAGRRPVTNSRPTPPGCRTPMGGGFAPCSRPWSNESAL